MGSTFQVSGGIQDIVTILLGTALSNFLSKSTQHLHEDTLTQQQHLCLGNLGVVSVGFKTLVVCLKTGILKSKVIWNMGFDPQGESLSLITVEAGTN